MKNIFCQTFFLVFETKQFNYCWRVIKKDILKTIPQMLHEVIKEMEAQGKTEIRLVKIERI